MWEGPARRSDSPAPAPAPPATSQVDAFALLGLRRRVPLQEGSSSSSIRTSQTPPPAALRRGPVTGPAFAAAIAAAVAAAAAAGAQSRGVSDVLKDYQNAQAPGLQSPTSTAFVQGRAGDPSVEGAKGGSLGSSVPWPLATAAFNQQHDALPATLQVSTDAESWAVESSVSLPESGGPSLREGSPSSSSGSSDLGAGAHPSNSGSDAGAAVAAAVVKAEWMSDFFAVSLPKLERFQLWGSRAR